MSRIILITGRPGVGKTTFLKKVLDHCGSLAITGFYTEEVLQDGKRTGFRAVALNGSSAVFAHQTFHVPPTHQVGKYGVRPEILERLALPHIDPERKRPDLIVIDEIAKMELISKPFREKLLEILDSRHPLLATVALMGTGLIKRIKKRPDALVFILTRENRDRLVPSVAEAVLKAVSTAGRLPADRL